MREAEVIGLIEAAFPEQGLLTQMGIGDDAAILRGEYPLVTCDVMNEGVHFSRAFMSLSDVSYRALSSNLSDIAAMGGQPGPFVLGLTLPKGGLTRVEVEALVGGFRECIDDHQLKGRCVLVGGDVVRGELLGLSITLMGALGSEGARLRGDAREGDALVVTQPLGGSGAALVEFLEGKEPAASIAREFLRPVADVALGEALGEWPHRCAVMDLSDGLAQDLPRMARASGVGMRVELEWLPVVEEVRRVAQGRGLSPWHFAVSGGEEYCLCCALASKSLPSFIEMAEEVGCGAYRIGSVTAGGGCSFWEAGVQVEVNQGFEHF